MGKNHERMLFTVTLVTELLIYTTAFDEDIILNGRVKIKTII